MIYIYIMTSHPFYTTLDGKKSSSCLVASHPPRLHRFSLSGQGWGHWTTTSPPRPWESQISPIDEKRLVGGAITILKHDGVKVSWGDDIPIYEMENKIHVWNHQPDRGSPVKLCWNQSSAGKKHRKTSIFATNLHQNHSKSLWFHPKNPNPATLPLGLQALSLIFQNFGLRKGWLAFFEAWEVVSGDA